VRIIAGRNRGLTLAALGKGDPGAHLRPTTDRVREALFNTLAGGRFGDPITDAVVLDLFAGTGALALEALSRGAARAVLVEAGHPAQRLIVENIARCRAQSTARLLRRDATKLGPADTAATLVFLDPPYGKGLGDRALATARDGGWIAPGALVVWEENAPQPAPPGFALLDQRRYGETHVSFMEADA
jgi:16S rRNA (guanine966-N2)-methyltransferase